jgi:hypothetical protein
MITFDIATKATEAAIRAPFLDNWNTKGQRIQLCIHKRALLICEGLRIANFIIKEVSSLKVGKIAGLTLPAGFNLDPLLLNIALIAIQSLHGKQNYFSSNENGTINVFWCSKFPDLTDHPDTATANLCIAVALQNETKINEAAKLVDANARGPFGRTPIFFNLYSAHIYNVLLDHGANDKIEDNFGVTPQNMAEIMDF